MAKDIDHLTTAKAQIEVFASRVAMRGNNTRHDDAMATLAMIQAHATIAVAQELKRLNDNQTEVAITAACLRAAGGGGGGFV